MKPIIIIAIAVVLLIPVSAFGQFPELQTYTNNEFGFKIDHPATWFVLDDVTQDGNTKSILFMTPDLVNGLPFVRVELEEGFFTEMGVMTDDAMLLTLKLYEEENCDTKNFVENGFECTNFTIIDNSVLSKQKSYILTAGWDERLESGESYTVVMMSLLVSDGDDLWAVKLVTDEFEGRLPPLIIGSFQVTHQQQESFDIANELKQRVDEGEILDYTNPEITINEIKIIEKDRKDLLVINFQFTPTVTRDIFNTQFDRGLRTLKAAQGWDSNYESFSNLITVEYSFLGTTMHASDEWSEKCPVYLGKTINPRIPTDLIACFEIPKDVTIFSFEEIQFSRSANVEEDNSSLSEQSTIISSEQKTSNSGGGCLIATAIYGSELAPQVQQLRELRDNKLLNTESGTSFINSFNDFYYSFSPIIADYERENPVFKEMVKIAITPMISSLSILNYVDMDSEVEVLGYGISLILLNIGMYVGVPASVIIGMRRRIS